MRRSVRCVAAALMLAVVGACSAPADDGTQTGEETTEPGAASTEAPSSAKKGPSQTAAADLTTSLNALLSEHVALLGAMASAGVPGRQPEYAAATNALKATGASNSTDIAAGITSAYGDGGKAFDPLWRKHIDFFVNYIDAVNKKDNAGKKTAVDSLTAYSTEFGKFMEGASGMSSGTVSNLVIKHANQVKEVVDAVRLNDYKKAYNSQRTAYSHMHEIADAIAEATDSKFPKKFPGDPASDAAALRSRITRVLREHVYLATQFASAKLGGRPAEATAALEALNGNGSSNSTDLVGVIESAYGSQAKATFNGLWRSHIGFLGEYIDATAAKNGAGQKAAVDKLTKYSTDFATAMAGLNGFLKKEAVTELVNKHILGLKAVVDALAAKNYEKAYTEARTAASHMSMIADPLTEATIKKFPSQYS